LAGASAQLRNAATIGGNLLQRTRCCYFYDTATACNKRAPGAGCGAIGGFNRMHAILGASQQCIATNPSDMCVALAVLDAKIRVVSVDGERVIPFDQFHRLPGDTPHIDTNLRPGELITAVDLPADDFRRHYTYLKLRDRLSYAFALVSVAAALRMEDGRIAEARLALGGVAHRPWRDRAAEQLLSGQTPAEAAFDRTAAAMLVDARGQGHNDFKIALARRAIVRALNQAVAGTSQSPTNKRVA
jgi:xanthine dehydrogenase YagS FAD-binding subunit